MQIRSTVFAVSLLAAFALCGLTRDRAEAAGGAEKPLLAEHLDNVPGSDLTAVVVNYGPGGKSPEHHHAGSVFAYVISGSIRSQNSMTGPVRVYRAGEAFFEPAGSAHLISENASDTEPASLLAVFVAPTNATLTLPGRR
jgi:quercetin dioxygenase-like cupin family protein